MTGQDLRAELLELGITQNGLALMLEVHQRTVRRWLAGSLIKERVAAEIRALPRCETCGRSTAGAANH